MTEPEIVTRAVDITSFDVLEGERAIVARINTAAIDRLKTIIDPMGCDVSHFNKTQSVLWHHGQDPIRGMLPIGRGWVKVRKAERDMIGKTSFGKDEFSDLCYQGAKEGNIKSWSIKAAVHESSPPTREELRAMPALEECEMVYRKWDLIEYSLTPIPGNSDCLSMMIGRGFIKAPEGFVVTPPVKEEPTPEPIAPHVEQDGGFWVVRGLLCESPRFVKREDADEMLAMATGQKVDAAALYSPDTVSRFHLGLLQGQRAENDQFRRDIEAMLDLKVNGRV